ncbi:MAG: GTP-binding protein [Christensenellales bacterium]
MTEERRVPVYIVTGFLDSGKTRFINEMLKDPGFSGGERTLLLRCEEGEGEYDAAQIAASNAVVHDLHKPEEMDEQFIALDAQYLPERVIIEYNATWMLKTLYDAPKPDAWTLGQIITLIDANTYMLYLTNMRDFMNDGIREADLVLFNRCALGTTKSLFRRRVRALNDTTAVYFENIDGTTDDGVGEEDLPYDMSKHPIVVRDDQFGIWYLDALEHPDRYDGKTMRFKVQIAYMNQMPTGCFVASRLAMTCCADDIGGIGFVCQGDGPLPEKGKYYELVARVEKAHSPVHGREALILIQRSIRTASRPKDDVVYFS